MTSRRTFSATAVAAVKRGATDYLAKPVTVDEVLSALGEKSSVPEATDDYSPMSVERLEWEHIQQVLARNEGNISQTARRIGVGRSYLHKKLKQFNH